MSYQSFKNKETWLLNVWNYIEEIASVWTENEKANGACVTDISAEYCKDSFEMMVEDTLDKVPNGIISDFIQDSISVIDWMEVAECVKDIIREENQ